MTSYQRVLSLVKATEHVARHNIPGALVECGVWRGGSMMAAAKTLLHLGRPDRDLYLYDTFAGMPEPTAEDGAALAKYLNRQSESPAEGWLAASEQLVSLNLQSTGYPMDRVHLIKGMVEETIPAQAPESIAILRLDTDWYESTRHTITHLFPRLRTGGILVVDGLRPLARLQAGNR